MRTVLKGVALVLLLSALVGPAFVLVDQALADPPTYSSFTYEQLHIDNPCTPEVEDISGYLVSEGRLHQHAGEPLSYNTRNYGKLTDATTGLKYTFRGVAIERAHDEWPWIVNVKGIWVSQKGVDNWWQELSIFTNNQGEITRVKIVENECRG